MQDCHQFFSTNSLLSYVTTSNDSFRCSKAYFMTAFDHHNSANKLEQPLMMPLSCNCKFNKYELLDKYKRYCPYILVTIKGPHQHPIPLLSKTPAVIHEMIFTLLRSLGIDLPDLTPCRFLWHLMLQTCLHKAFPYIPHPVLSDVHPSLANHAHLGKYIEAVCKTEFLYGTDWNGKVSVLVIAAAQPSTMHLTMNFDLPGVKHMREKQDKELPARQHYILTMTEVSMRHDAFDNDNDNDNECPSGVDLAKDFHNNLYDPPEESTAARDTICPE